MNREREKIFKIISKNSCDLINKIIFKPLLSSKLSNFCFKKKKTASPILIFLYTILNYYSVFCIICTLN